jgi:uncharacterized membrane protein
MRVTDRWIERMVSVLLLAGVVLAAGVVALGGILFLVRHGGDPVNFGTFHSEPQVDRLLGDIISAAFAGRARSLIQLGIVLLIATPVTRVAFSLVGFALERDRIYVAITTAVLAVLLYSLIHGALG